MSDKEDSEAPMSDNLWDRRPAEPDKAWAAFVVYRNLGAAIRTVAKVAEIHGKSTRNYEEMAQNWDWSERCRAYDVHQDKLVQKADADAVIEMRKRQIQLGKLFQALSATVAKKLLEAERLSKKTKLSPRDAAALADIGVKLERLNSGEATDRVESNITGTIAPAEFSEAMKDDKFREALDAAANRRSAMEGEPRVDGGEAKQGELEKN